MIVTTGIIRRPDPFRLQLYDGNRTLRTHEHSHRAVNASLTGESSSSLLSGPASVCSSYHSPGCSPALVESLC
jgi:hypothetical protein